MASLLTYQNLLRVDYVYYFGLAGLIQFAPELIAPHTDIPGLGRTRWTRIRRRCDEYEYYDFVPAFFGKCGGLRGRGIGIV